MAIKNVTLLGADGSLGPFVLDALLDAKFNVTVLKRKSSKSPSNYPSSVKDVRVSDDFPEDELEKILQNQDAVIITTRGSLIDIHKRVARAAAKLGVQRLIPADFGSVDSDSQLARDLVPFYNDKRNFRLYLTDLARENSDFSWTALVCGHFFYDGSLDFLHIWKKTDSVDIFGDGHVKASASTMKQTARATIRILQFADKPETKNKMLFVQSFCKSQIEVKDSLERVTAKAWKVNSLDGDEFVSKHKEFMKGGGEAEAEASEELVWYLGSMDADWTKRDAFAMKDLELEEEDLDEVVREALNL